MLKKKKSKMPAWFSFLGSVVSLDKSVDPPKAPVNLTSDDTVAVLNSTNMSNVTNNTLFFKE